MGEHTQGPWSVGDLDDNGQRIVRGEHIEIATCWHHCVGSIEKEMEANDRLIAAAPDLLAALKGLREAYLAVAKDDRILSLALEHPASWVKCADAAIAKALCSPAPEPSGLAVLGESVEGES